MLSELLSHYLEDAWPFALAHAVVLCLALFSLWKINRERQDLAAWEPADEPVSERKHIYSKQILQQFVDECKELGPKGLLVPMTDFSDRLDFRVSGLGTELSEKANLLLVIGIAGTIFGVFEFSSGSYSSGQLQGMDQLTQLLMTSMAKAFPVGFVGLVLMLVTNLVSAPLEERLRDEVAAATARAIEFRKQVTHPESELLAEAVGRIETVAAGIEVIAENIRKSLVPLETLESTLTKSVQPVVEEFGERLDESLSLIKEQFNQFEKTTNELSGSVKSLEEGTQSLKAMSEHVGDVLGRAPQVLEQSVSLQSQFEQGFTKLRIELEKQLENADTVEKGMRKAVEKLEAFPETMKQQLAHSLQWLAEMQGEVKSGVSDTLTDIRVSAIESWRTTLTELMGSIQSEQLRYVDLLTERHKSIAGDLKVAAAECVRQANAAHQLVREPIEGLVKQAKADVRELLVQLDSFISREYPLLLQNVKAVSSELTESLTSARSAREELSNWASVQHELNSRAVVTADSLLGALEEGQRDLDGRFRDQQEAIKSDLVGVADELKGEVRRVGERESQILSRVDSIANAITSRNGPPSHQPRDKTAAQSPGGTRTEAEPISGGCQATSWQGPLIGQMGVEVPADPAFEENKPRTGIGEATTTTARRPGAVKRIISILRRRLGSSKTESRP